MWQQLPHGVIDTQQKAIALDIAVTWRHAVLLL